MKTICCESCGVVLNEEVIKDRGITILDCLNYVHCPLCEEIILLEDTE